MKTTEEKNRMIAEFMGVGIFEETGMYNASIGSEYPVKEIPYHTSWDWLMPVVEKIESIEDDLSPYQSYSKNNFCVSIRNGFCQIISGDFLMDFDEFDKHSGTKKEAVFNAVCEFIEWYNENK